MPKRKRSSIKAARKTNTSQKRRRPLIAAVVLSVIMLAALPFGWVALHPRASSTEGLAADVAGAVGFRAGSKPADGKQPPQSPKKTDSKSSGSRAVQGQAAKKAAAEAQKQTDAKIAATKTGASSAAAPQPAAAHVATPAPVPAPAPAPAPAGWHDNIITTVFWVGEAASADNAGISNAESAWDGNWQTHYGGFDDPDHRNGYYPAAFTPKENPFYFALPYNDLAPNGRRKASAGNCPNTSSSVSWCKNAWIKISFGGKVAYAQWQDVGPMLEDDVNYVFGSARPSNTWGARAGLDVSPAVRDYLGLSGVDHTSWSFVPASAVPGGPWKSIITTSQGGW